jgi:hypothetical protein
MAKKSVKSDKQHPASKKKGGTGSKPSDALAPASHEPPMDLLCDVAWKVACCNQRFSEAIPEALATPPAGKEALLPLWRQAVHLAHVMISEAKRENKQLAEEAAIRWGMISEDLEQYMAFRDGSALTTEEKERNSVSFRRGCKFITGLLDGRDAEKRFALVLPWLGRHTRKPVRPLDSYKSHGFSVAHLSMLLRAFKKLPKEALRKPYEKTGRYRRNKQGRPRNPKK